MALSLQSGACSTGVPTIATDLTVAKIERLKDSAIRIWYTLPVDLGTNKANSTTSYAISGPETLTISRATQTSVDSKAIDLYFDKPLSYGQWTVSFVSANITCGEIALPSNTTYVFEIVEINQEPPGLETDNNLTKKFFNPAFISKSNWEALIATLEDNRLSLADLTQKCFKQSFLSTATGKYLGIRASDYGVVRPSLLGLTDETFRKLAISVINEKLTKNANLSLLEILYGTQATRANITSLNAEPFKLFDQASLTLVIDGLTLPIKFAWADFNNMLWASAEEVCFVLNQKFLALNSTAFACPFVNPLEDKTYVRIYSGSPGLKSSIAVTAGTSRPIFNFGDCLFPPSLYDQEYRGD